MKGKQMENIWNELITSVCNDNQHATILLEDVLQHVMRDYIFNECDITEVDNDRMEQIYHTLSMNDSASFEITHTVDINLSNVGRQDVFTRAVYILCITIIKHINQIKSSFNDIEFMCCSVAVEIKGDRFHISSTWEFFNPELYKIYTL
jgi:hypothetical protein